MNNKTSITALMSSFGRAFHAENEEHPVFADYLAKELMTAEEYTAVQNYSELEKLLEKYGFLIYELLVPENIQRDVIDKTGADMKASEHVNYCLAVRKK